MVGDERLEAREGGGWGVDCIEAVVSPPASEGLSQGVAGHWPRCGALGLGKSSVSSGTMRRHTKPKENSYKFDCIKEVVNYTIRLKTTTFEQFS